MINNGFWIGGAKGGLRHFLRFTLLLTLFVAGCASPMSVEIQSPFAMGDGRTEYEKKHDEAVVKEIIDRNSTVEADPEWISEAYKKFMINNVSDIDEQDYAKYSRYLDNGAVYIIVHPSYYTFFHEGDVSNDGAGISSQNAVERFLDESVYSSKARLIKAQEKMLRDFLEYMSTEKKLVILILPKGYSTYPGYKYRNVNDEYMRYINEVSNGSDSILYIYSKKPSRGTLSEKDRKKVLKFLYGVRANSILLGGGYIGRCLEDFYKDIEQYIGEDKIFLVPEITAISPSDMISDIASDVLRPDGTINVPKLSFSIKTNALGNQEITPLIRNLSSAANMP